MPHVNMWMSLADARRMLEAEDCPTASSAAASNLAEEEANTIYYLICENPDERDVSMFGPFHCREAFIPTLIRNIEKDAPLGLSMLHDMLCGPIGAQGFIDIRSPISPSGEHRLTVRLEKPENRAVKDALPCPTWTVMQTEIIREGVEAHVMEMELCEAYLKKEDADRRVREVVVEVTQNLGSYGDVLEHADRVIVHVEGDGKKLIWIFPRFDPGEIPES